MAEEPVAKRAKIAHDTTLAVETFSAQTDAAPESSPAAPAASPSVADNNVDNDHDNEPLWLYLREDVLALGWSVVSPALLVELETGGLYRCLAAVDDGTISRPEETFCGLWKEQRPLSCDGAGFSLAAWPGEGGLRAVLQARLATGGDRSSPVYAIDEAQLKLTGDYSSTNEEACLKLQFHGAAKAVDGGPLYAFDCTCWSWEDSGVAPDCHIAVQTLRPGIDFCFFGDDAKGITNVQTTRAGDLMLKLPNSDWRNAYFFRRVDGVAVDAECMKSLMKKEGQRSGRNCD